MNNQSKCLRQLMWIGVLTAGACLALPGAGLAAQQAEPDAKPPVSGDADQPALSAGKVVHIDPATGRKKPMPSAADRAAGRAHLQSVINRSSAGLFETSSPRSGVMVNLQGRFRHATSLMVAPSGEVASECTATLPPTPALAVDGEVDND